MIINDRLARLDYQPPLFRNLGEEQRLDSRERRKSSLPLGLLDQVFELVSRVVHPYYTYTGMCRPTGS